MKLVVKNVGSDLKPCFLVYTETGELIENVHSLSVSCDAMSDITTVEMEFDIYQLKYPHAVAAPNQVEIT